MQMEIRALVVLFSVMVAGMAIYYYRFYYCPHESLEACVLEHNAACGVQAGATCEQQLRAHECICNTCSRCMSKEQRLMCVPGKFTCA
jgi:hypothetical protein